jgi:phage/plasmid-like protein (TIGR03299 family)
MVAAVETMTYFGKTPWHGEGVPMPESARFSVSEGLSHSGLDTDVEIIPIFTGDGQDVTCGRAVRRTSDKRIFGVVGPRYTPLQNRDAFDWFAPMFDAKLAALNTAGALHSGSKVWILAEIMGAAPLEIAKDDSVARFLMISNSHDGTTSVRVGFTPIRVVCANTLAMAHSNAASKLIRLRHHKDVKVNLDKLRDVINLANKEFEATAEQYRHLASRRVNVADLKKYVRLVAGVDESVKDEDIPTRTQNTMTDLLNRMVNGIGQANPAVAGTWWAAYNGVNEYLNYAKGRTVSNRMDSLWFGTSATDNANALKAALTLAA